jgi:hypothetical protein
VSIAVSTHDIGVNNGARLYRLDLVLDDFLFSPDEREERAATKLATFSRSMMTVSLDSAWLRKASGSSSSSIVKREARHDRPCIANRPPRTPRGRDYTHVRHAVGPSMDSSGSYPSDDVHEVSADEIERVAIWLHHIHTHARHSENVTRDETHVNPNVTRTRN